MTFPGSEHCEKKTSDLVFFWDMERRILFRYDEWGDTINGGEWHACWKPNDLNNTHEFTSSGSFIRGEEGEAPTIWQGYWYYVAARFNIERLEQNGEFIYPWVGNPRINPCHFSEKNYDDREALCRERFASFPDEVKKTIGLEE